MQEIAAALNRQDYPEVERLLATLPSEDPWSILYRGQLDEATQAWDRAEQAYRQLLRQDNGPKITREARQGLQRIKTWHQDQRQQRMDEVTAQPGQTEPGILILESVPSDAKAQAAINFAKIMQIDPYSARLLLPSRGWRLYRAGPVGELQVYGQELQAEGIPTFWLPLNQINQIQVLEISYFSAVTGTVETMIRDHDQGNTLRSFSFKWSDVTQRVEGQLPIFEEVVDRDPRGKLKRKQKIQDHAQFCDLHLPKQGLILRLYDVAYHFNQGVALSEETSENPSLAQGTSWVNWRALNGMLNLHLPDTPVWSDFTPFGETAMDHTEVLERLHSHIHLLRRIDTYWDQAFHLYSGLVFLKNQGA